MPPPIHPHFQQYLDLKDGELIELYQSLRAFLFKLYPESNELLYHTHALTSVYTLSEKLGDAFCMIPIYSKHLNLGFNKGTLLKDPDKLLQGTGKLIRHIPINTIKDFKNTKVKKLVLEAIAFAKSDLDKPSSSSGKIISKIKV